MFLNQLLKPHRQANTVFERLYKVLNDWGGENNFSRIILLVAKIWAISEYANPNNKIYKNFSPTTPLAYQQKYILGFRNDDFNFEFKNEELLIEQLDLPVPIPGTIRFQKHHIFQPIEIVNVVETKNEELLIANEVPIPAFYLKAFDDKGAWENFEKSLWLVFDVVALFTGVGNLAKLRLLAQTEKITYIAIKTTFGVVQVASSTFSIGLALIQNSKNSEVVNTVREYLFWAEVCTLSLDVISSKILRLKARNAQEILIANRMTIKDSDELKEIDEFLDHLDEVVDLDLMGKSARIGELEGKILTASQKRRYVGELKQNGIETFLEEDLKLSKKERITNKQILYKFKPFVVNELKFDSVDEFYFFMRQKGYSGAFHAQSKQLFLTLNPTKYVAFHEKMHVKHYLEKKQAYFALKEWEKETYVFLEIWKQKQLWSKAELEHALKYVNRIRKDSGQKPYNYKI